MIKKISALLIMIAICWMPLYAQVAGNFSQNNAPNNAPTPPGNAPAKPVFSLFDPARFHMSQSYSFMYSSSKAGSSNVAMYLNSIEYQISNPLQIRFDIGYLHSPGAVLKSGTNGLQNGQIIPGVSLSWRPSNNFMFRLDYRQVPVLYNNGGYLKYYNGLWNDR